MQSWKNWFRSLVAFGAARGGNVAITFAFATFPLLAAVGASVDYSRANSVKASMQDALDATALMLSKEAATVSTDRLKTDAQKYFAALLTRPDAKIVLVDANYTTTGGSKVTVNASVSVPTTIMGAVGYDSIGISGTSTTTWGSTRLRVALVLDNTLSMASDSKMGALKTATNNLLTQLKGAASVNGDVYVSIVPFVKDVNVGSGTHDADWIDWNDWDAQNGSCSKSGNNTPSKCSSHNGTWTHANHTTWNGCVTDRGNSNGPNVGNYDTNVVAPNINIQATRMPAEQYASCPQAIKPLSYDWDAMTTLVNSMSPNGNTNQAIGLMHGWMSLVGGGPYPTPPIMDSNYTYRQIIILLTDGLNTENRWSTSETSIDNRQKLTCDNVKAAGITLYTIQVNTGHDRTSTLLHDCASTPSDFFLLTSANQMVATFEAIGTDLTQLRVAK